MATLPLRERKRDYFFVACFSFFAFSSFFSDAWHALGLMHGEGFWPEANRWYAEFAQDHYFAAEHDYLRVATMISAFIYGPFYLTLVFAFIKGKNWVRLPSLIYVGMMMHGMIEYISWEHWIGPAPGKPLIFWAFNGPYAVVPILLAIRMWRPEPFSAAASGA